VPRPGADAIPAVDASDEALTGPHATPERSAPRAESVRRNSALLTVGTLGARAAAFLTAVVAARQLEPGVFAVVLLAQAVAQYMAMVVDFGFTLAAIRTVARTPSRVRQVAGAVLSVRAVLGVAGVLAVWIGSVALDMSPDSARVFILFAIATSVAALDLSWVAQSRESAGLRGVVLGGSGLLSLMLLIVLLPAWRDPAVVPIAQLTATGVFVVLSAHLVRRRYGSPARPDRSVLRQTIVMALPIGLATLMAQVYYNLDLILLGILRSPEEVAAYGSVYKLILGLLMIAWTYALVVLPRFTRASADGLPTLRREFGLRLRHMAGLLVPLCVGAAFVAEPLVIAVFGLPYATGWQPLVILLLSVPISAFGSLTLYTLIARGRRWALPASTGSGAVVNVALNLLLIPPFGMVGAGWATIISVTVVLGVGVALARTGLPRIDWRAIGRLAVISAVVAGAAALSGSLPVIVVAGVGGVSWLIAGLAVEYWTAEERDLVLRTVRRLAAR
jgi:O-antigen/teichoic acid export membrane protein